MKELSICLTGTIKPHTSFVSRGDVQERLADYKSAIAFYLKHTELPLAFVENSDFDLEADPDFRAWSALERFQLIRLSTHPDTHLGKGFQEFYMLDRFVEEHLSTTRFVKITGRYIIRNIGSILPRLKGRLHIDLHRKRALAITAFFAVERSLYLEHLKACYREADDARMRFIEHVVYDAICSGELIKEAELLPEGPVYEGVSGSHGSSLNRHPLKRFLRERERQVIRSLGIEQFLIEY